MFLGGLPSANMHLLRRARQDSAINTTHNKEEWRCAPVDTEKTANVAVVQSAEHVSELFKYVFSATPRSDVISKIPDSRLSV